VLYAARPLSAHRTLYLQKTDSQRFTSGNRDDIQIFFIAQHIGNISRIQRVSGVA